MSIIDITVPLRRGVPLWPGSSGFNIGRYMNIEKGDEANVSFFSCDIHTGTHIDAPHHFVEEGKSVDQLSLDLLCGPAVVADLTEADEIGDNELSGLALPGGTERVIFKTTNSGLWKEDVFSPSYVSMTEGGARWIVKSGIRVVGIDYLSIGPYPDGAAVHRILLAAGVVVIESIDLTDVEAGEYELLCLPMKIEGAEGAPARVALRAPERGSL